MIAEQSLPHAYPTRHRFSKSFVVATSNKKSPHTKIIYQSSELHGHHQDLIHASSSDPIMLKLSILVLFAAYTIVESFAPQSSLAAITGKTSHNLSKTSLTMMSNDSLSNSQHILFDMPVSNNGARCRIILYKKEIPTDQVEIISPTVLGGLKSDAYLQRSPQGLMPCLSIQKPGSDMKHLAESDTIARYLLSEYSDLSPSFQPENHRSNQICRWHDVYLTPIQGCLYKPASRLPVGDYADRKSALKAFRKNLEIIEGFMSDDGVYLCGKEVSLADATLFPTAIFANYMLPKFNSDGEEVSDPLPPKLSKWFHELRASDPVFTKVYDEIMDVLVHSWEENNHRWDSIWLAGQRDTAPATIFDKIIAGEIPATIVKEDDHILAFKDINPMAPAHILVIPKDRNGLTNLRQASLEHTDILGRLLVAAGEIAKDESLGFGDGARIVVNDGPDGGQEVMHLHVHVLGGRKLEGKLG